VGNDARAHAGRTNLAEIEIGPCRLCILEYGRCDCMLMIPADTKAISIDSVIVSASKAWMIGGVDALFY